MYQRIRVAILLTSMSLGITAGQTLAIASVYGITNRALMGSLFVAFNITAVFGIMMVRFVASWRN